MPITEKDKLFILRDLLNNQHCDCCGTSNECAQIKRLAEQFLQNNPSGVYAEEILTAILDYGHTGTTHATLNDHITSHKDDLQSWVNHLDTYQ